MTLEDIAKSITDETKRQQFLAVAGEVPAIKDFLEFGERVQPVRAKLAEMKVPDPDRAIAEVPAWLDWREKNWDNEHNMTRGQAALAEQLATVNQELETLRAKGENTEMTLEEIKADLIKDGYVRKDDLKTSKVVDEPTLMGALNAQAQRFQELYGALTPLAVEHKGKFNEPIPVKSVFEHMEKTGERDPIKAYDTVMAPKVRELETAQHKAEVEAAKAEGVKAGLQQAQQSLQGRAIPVDSKGGVSGSHFFKRIQERRAEAAKTSGGRLGDGTAANAGFAEYQQRLIKQGAA